MLALTLSLCCSLSWGTSDFLGGFLGRRLPLLTVLACSQGLSFCLGLAVAFALGGAPPWGAVTLYAFAAGACTIVGVGALYRALSMGTMGVVAPLAATSALMPVLYGLALGERPSVLQAAGMAVALGGVIAAARQSTGADAGAAGRTSLLYAGLAALGFGAVQILLAEGASTSVWWTIGYMRLGAVALLALGAAVLLAGRPVREPRRGPLPLGLLALTGLLDISAATFYAAATTHGLRTVVAVLGSLYPVVTVLLARMVLHERLARHQALGAVATLAGVVVVAAG